MTLALVLFVFGAARLTPWDSLARGWPIVAHSLAPLVPTQTPPPILGERGIAWDARWEWIPFALGVFAVGLFLLSNAIASRLRGRASPAASFAVVALFLASPAMEGFLRIDGGRWILLALALQILGMLCALSSRILPLAALGVVLVAGAALIHPSVAALSVCTPLLLKFNGELRGRRFLVRSGEIWVASLSCAVLGREAEFPRFFSQSPLWVAKQALLDAASLPAELCDGARRSLIPTGFEALAGRELAPLNLAIWGGLLLLSWILLRWRVAVAVLGTTLLAAVLGAWLSPLWVPGSRPQLFLFAIPAVLSLGSLAAGRGGTGLRNFFLGLGIAAIFLSLSLARHREADLARRARALGIPSLETDGVAQFRPDLEPDPARLGLFLYDAGPEDAYAELLRGELTKRLEAGAPSPAPEVLAALAAPPKLELAPTDTAETVKVRARAQAALEAVQDLQGRWERSGVDILPMVLEECRLLLPEVLELHFESPKDLAVRKIVPMFQRLLNVVSSVATLVGRLDDSIALREGLYELSGREPGYAPRLARQLRERGELDRALELVNDAIPRMKDGIGLKAMAQAVKGQVLLSKGQVAEGLARLQRAWGVLRRSTRRLKPSHFDYWVVAEIGLDRYEAVKAVDPEFLPQATKDVRPYVEDPLNIGIRRVPALVLGARWLVDQGDRDRALGLMKEFAELRTTSDAERADGPRGRFDHPYYRRMGWRFILKTWGEDQELSVKARDALKKLDGG